MGNSDRPRIGLALGSGGARGLAHIGVIKVLVENNIPIDCIAGSSIGALVGGFYAAGLDIKKIENIASETDFRKLFSLIDPHLKQGLMGGEKITAFIESNIDGKKIEDCKIPFAAIATDFKTGEAVVLNKGDMAPAIRASISVPLAFKPVTIDGRLLADGGLSSPVPVKIVRSMGADIVIAVNLDRHYSDEEVTLGWYEIANDSLNILRHNLALLDTAGADIVIDINSGKSYWYEFVNGQNKILIGEQATKEILPTVQKLLLERSKSGIGKYFGFFAGHTK